MRIVLLSLPAVWSSSAGKVVQAFDADWFVLFRKLLERHFSAECETVVYKLTVSVVCRSLTWGGLCALWFRWWHTLTLGVIGCVRPAPHVKLAVAAGLVPVLMKHSCLHKPGPPAQRLLQTLEVNVDVRRAVVPSPTWQRLYWSLHCNMQLDCVRIAWRAMPCLAFRCRHC